MDKLTILNRALNQTGNNTLTVLNDGSEEWCSADIAFERYIEDLMSRHGWPFARVNDTLTLAPDADNPSSEYDYAFALPADLIHVARIRHDGYPVSDYEISGRYVAVDYDSAVTIEGYAMPADADWHPQAAEILTLYLEAAIYSGLNEDPESAYTRERQAEGRLMEARPRVTRQNPAANTYVSTIATARRVRRG